MRDDCFIRGSVPMTKSEVRAVAVDLLDLGGARSLLDIGAGTGSVCVQAGSIYPTLAVTAIERNEEGVTLIRANAERHGVAADVLHAEAPADLAFRHAPFDRVFLGGTGRQIGAILDWIAPFLTDGCVLVMTTITIESFADLIEALRARPRIWTGIEATQLQASRLEPLGSYSYFKPQNPCTLVRFVYRGKQENL